MNKGPYFLGDEEYDHTAAGMAIGLAYGVRSLAYLVAVLAVAGIIYIGVKVF